MTDKDEASLSGSQDTCYRSPERLGKITELGEVGTVLQARIVAVNHHSRFRYALWQAVP